MLEQWKDDDFTIIKEKIMPVHVMCSNMVDNVENLLLQKPACISFQMDESQPLWRKGRMLFLISEKNYVEAFVL